MRKSRTGALFVVGVALALVTLVRVYIEGHFFNSSQADGTIRGRFILPNFSPGEQAIYFQTESTFSGQAFPSSSLATSFPLTREGSIQSTNVTPRSILADHDKPILIIHVGPMKTGSKTILKNIESHRILLEESDNFIFQGDQGPFMSKQCFLRNCTDMERDEWLMQLDQLHQLRRNLIISSEALATVDADAFNKTRDLFQILKGKWRIRIVMVYRPYYSWIRSMFRQSYESHMFKPNAEAGFVDRTNAQNVTNYSSFVDWIEERHLSRLRKNLAPLGGHDGLTAYRNYERILGGTQDLIVLDTYQSQELSLVQAFLIHAMPEATHAISAIADKPELTDNSSEFPATNYLENHIAADQIVRQAHHLGLIPTSVGNLELRRIIFTKISLAYNNNELPLKCLNEEQQDFLWNYSALSYEVLAKESLLDLTIQRKTFETRGQSISLCFIDAAAVMKQHEWMQILEVAVANLTGVGQRPIR